VVGPLITAITTVTDPIIHFARVNELGVSMRDLNAAVEPEKENKSEENKRINHIVSEITETFFSHFLETFVLGCI
jgi:hypothetical protein